MDKHPARSVAQLQRHLDEFIDYYNTVRPHRACGRKPPISRYRAREKAVPMGHPRPHYRVRRDVVDKRGKVSLRFKGTMLHLYLGYRYCGSRVILHIVDERVRVLSEDYKLIGTVTIDPTKNHQAVKRA